ncbi:MAG: 2,3-bisphosphoglycerate-independent phosphoglycerate mutase [Pseudomonadota bacterium]
MQRDARVILIIMDGWGLRAEKEWNAIALARTPHYSRVLGKYPNGRVEASGTCVGLPHDVMGNSEVGHMNIGAGRRVVQDQVRIHESIDNGEFFQNPVLTKLVDETAARGKQLHLLGLISRGNVHTAERHYLALLDLISRRKFPMARLFVHALLDGRDTPPKSAGEYLATLEEKLKETGGRIATICGRYFTMDRDKRWERVDKGYRAMVLGEGEKAATPKEALAKAYARGETDEFVLPTVMTADDGNPMARIREGDGVICFNFRPDRMRQIVRAFTENEAPLPSLQKGLNLSLVSFTTYDKTFTNPVAFPPEEVHMCLGRAVSEAGGRQFRAAETEKYAHVTYFLNGGRETPFPNEERLMIQSPKVATYDLTPAMNSTIVTDAVVDRAKENRHRLIVVNFAQPDMIGHTGVFDAAIAAVEATDLCLGRILEAGLDLGFHVVITADHGNIELMKDPVTGQPHTAHTTNPVPLIITGPEIRGFRIRPQGALCDISPTILGLLEIPKPPEMSGDNLLVKC